MQENAWARLRDSRPGVRDSRNLAHAFSCISVKRDDDDAAWQIAELLSTRPSPFRSVAPSDRNGFG